MLSSHRNSVPVLAIIEARMGSTRFPGKVLERVHGKPILQIMVERLQFSREIESICIATTTNPADDEIVKLGQEMGVLVFRGPENNLLSRVTSAAVFYKFEVVASLTGDCPLLDPFLLDQMIRIFRINDCQFLTNCHLRSYPDGMDIQILETSALIKAHKSTLDSLEQEHTTLHIRRNPQIFKTIHIAAISNEYNPDLGLTLDEREDLELLRAILFNFYPRLDFNLRDILEFLALNPHLILLNSNVKRKGDT
jgi:spore coat polysaccharide biosynthesis protein SpsF